MADGYISQIKTPDNKVYLLKDSEKGYNWNAITQGQKWSRICLITPTVITEGSSGILSVSCTRGNVVCNATFLITASHASKCFINALGTTNYSAVRIRGVVQSNGTAYIELYDTAHSIASGTTQTWHCSYIPILSSTVTTYTAFTDGTTLPSGYTAVNDFTAPQGDNSAPVVSISRNGTTFTATRSNGSSFTFTQQDNNTTYSAGTGLSLGSGNVFNHASSITAGTAGTSSATSGASIAIPYVTYNATGHITATGTHTHTISAANLGLASALKYIGSKNSLPTATDSTTYSAYNNGDVITVNYKEYAYVKGSNAAGSSWVELGDEGSYKLKQTELTDSTGTSESTTATRFVYSVSQNADGVISVKTRPLPTYNNYSHPTGDGNLHVPATGTTNNGKFLKAGSTAGSISWATLTVSDISNIASTYLKLDGSNNMTADVNIIAGDTDKFVNFWYNTGKTAGGSWRIGMLGSGSSDTNYFVIQSGTSTTSATVWNNVLRIGQNTYDAGFGGNVYPLTNNSKTLGTSSLKWNNVYATTFTGNLTGNATSADSTKWFMNRGGSTVTISDGPWAHGQTGSGGTNAATVWHQRWKQSGLTYTPSGGSATTLTDSGDMVLWLAQSATSNVLTVNMAIDGMIYALGGFKGNLTGDITGNAATVSRATFGNSGNGEHNANNIKSNGLWYYSSNGPATSLGATTGDGALYSQAYSTSWVGQIAQDYRDGALFVRGLNNGTWKSWYAIPKFTTTIGGLGGTTQPVYIDTNGELQTISYTIAKSVPSNAVFTDTNNAVTHTVKANAKYYVTGTETSTTSTGGDTFDTGIYATTIAGQLNATSYKVNENVTLQWNSTDSSLDFVFA